MLQLLRRIRRWLAGIALVLVAGAWLSAAAAPCIAAMDVQAHAELSNPAGPHAAGMHKGMQGDKDGDAHGCPHCEQAAAPCMDMVQDCDLPQSLAPPAHKAFKFQPALVSVAEIFPPPPEIRCAPLFETSAGPPRAGPPFTTLYCSFQE